MDVHDFCCNRYEVLLIACNFEMTIILRKY